MKNIFLATTLLLIGSNIAQAQTFDTLHESADHKEKLIKDKSTGVCTGTFEGKSGKTSLKLRKDNKLHAVAALLELKLAPNIIIKDGFDQREYGFGFLKPGKVGIVAFDDEPNTFNFIVYDGMADYIKGLKAQLVLVDKDTKAVSDFVEEYPLKDYVKILKIWRKNCQK